MGKRDYCDQNTSKTKKRKEAIALEEESEVKKRYERNERTVDIVRATGISEST
jgi:hypothetical protein